jgi:hypothetical protein
VRNDWGAATDWETVCRRNAGRRRYNAVRGFRRALRRAQVARLLLKYGRDGLARHGLQARVARELGVSPGTICRDVQAMMEDSRRARACPACGAAALPGWAGPDPGDWLFDGEAGPNDRTGRPESEAGAGR